jgi:hypothetical protein
MPLPKYVDCKYSLFVSYAHADDASNNNWVSALEKAVWRRLEKLDKSVLRKGLHLSKVNGPEAGRLEAALQERVSESFAMLIVVGSQYVDSGWCEKELELFNATFKEEGFCDRLIIAAMSKESVEAAQKKETWKKLVPVDQIWIPFFDEQGKRLTPKLTADDFTPEFWDAVEKLTDIVIAKIEENVEEPDTDMSEPEAVRAFAARSSRRVLIGAGTDDLTKVIDELRSKFAANPAFDVSLLDPRRLLAWEKSGDLEDVMRGHDVLVAPFSDAKPLLSLAGAGGHLAIEQREWERLDKSIPIIWYRAEHRNGAPQSATGGSAPAHKRFIDGLNPVYASYEAIEASLCKKASSKSKVVVYVEKNPAQTTLWRPLGDRMVQLWNELAMADPAPSGLVLNVRSLDIDRLDKDQSVTDADAVVLLCGNTHPTSLMAHIDLVEDALCMTGVPSGIVALLVPPIDPLKVNFPQHGWDYYRFSSVTPPGIRELEHDTVGLKEFLREVRNRCATRASDAGRVTAPQLN